MEMQMDERKVVRLGFNTGCMEGFGWAVGIRGNCSMMMGYDECLGASEIADIDG